jgi:hypothetical protein
VTHPLDDYGPTGYCWQGKLRALAIRVLQSSGQDLTSSLMKKRLIIPALLCACALVSHASNGDKKKKIEQELAGVPKPELPARVIDLVRQSPAHERTETAEAAIEAVSAKHPAATAAVVAAISREIPSVNRGSGNGNSNGSANGNGNSNSGSNGNGNSGGNGNGNGGGKGPSDNPPANPGNSGSNSGPGRGNGLGGVGHGPGPDKPGAVIPPKEPKEILPNGKPRHFPPNPPNRPVDPPRPIHYNKPRNH